MVTSLFSVLVSLILITSLIVGCSDMLSNNWNSLNEEKLKGELKRTYPSPDGEYTLKIYYVDREPFGSSAASGELVNQKMRTIKNIYWNYPDENPYVKWINNHTVIIGDKTLDVDKGDTYNCQEDQKKSTECQTDKKTSTSDKESIMPPQGK